MFDSLEKFLKAERDDLLPLLKSRNVPDEIKNNTISQRELVNFMLSQPGLSTTRDLAKVMIKARSDGKIPNPG